MKPFVSRETRHHSRLKKRLTAQSLHLRGHLRGENIASILRCQLRLFFKALVRSAQNKQVQKVLIYLSATVLLVYMLLWNWKIVLATSTGIAIMTLIYVLQNRDFTAYWRYWQAFLSGTNRKLAIATLGGGFAAIATYLAASIWTDLENRSLATGSILQGIGTLIIMSLVSWNIFLQNNRAKETKLEKYLQDLAHPDPLKRLIALRLLAKCQNQNYPSLTDYYRLMLTQESQPIIREALLELLAQSEQPLQIPLKVTQKIII